MSASPEDVKSVSLFVPKVKIRFGFKKGITLSQSIAVIALVVLATTEFFKDFWKFFKFF